MKKGSLYFDEIQKIWYVNWLNNCEMYPSVSLGGRLKLHPDDVEVIEVYQMYMDVIREEKAWADYLFKKGPVIGLNAQILKDFVDYTAVGALKEIGIKYQSSAPKSTPIPWFNKHVNTSNKQTALQENESTNYEIGRAHV